MKDLDWLIPSTILTALSIAAALLLIPDYSGIKPALGLLPMWMIFGGFISAVFGFVGLVRARPSSPIRMAIALCVQERRSLAILFLCIVISGMNMIAFMWIKPLLNYLVPFWADPLLADMDKTLFLGNDPWTALTWLNSTPTAIFYHRGWFGLMIITLIMVARSSPSTEKSALLITYFALWSIVGPVIHVLLPAAGPVFFAQMGYGDRFSDLKGIPATMEAANYLWTIYSTKGFGPGAGISAMPSMHIATTAWMVMCFYLTARSWLAPMVAVAALIFLLSISLGWHYAADGLVGGGAALLCFYAVRSLLLRKHRPVVPEPGLPAPAV